MLSDWLVEMYVLVSDWLGQGCRNLPGNGEGRKEGRKEAGYDSRFSHSAVSMCVCVNVSYCTLVQLVWFLLS